MRWWCTKTPKYRNAKQHNRLKYTGWTGTTVNRSLLFAQRKQPGEAREGSLVRNIVGGCASTTS